MHRFPIENSSISDINIEIQSAVDGRKYNHLDDEFVFSKDELALRRKSHATLKKVENDYEVRFAFNTAIAAIMELLNSIPENYKSNESSDSQKYCLDEAIIFILQMLSPIAPHICEYLWKNFYGEKSNIETSWPKFNESLLEVEEFELIIQVNGKVRGKMNTNKGIDQKQIEKIALEVDNVKNYINSSEIKKTIHVIK